jgi:hypothetical protein
VHTHQNYHKKYHEIDCRFAKAHTCRHDPQRAKALPVYAHAFARRASYTVQSPYQMDTFAPCPFSLSQLVDSRKALVWRNLSVSKRCTFLFPTYKRHRENQYMKNTSRVQTCPNLGHFSVEQM